VIIDKRIVEVYVLFYQYIGQRLWLTEVLLNVWLQEMNILRWQYPTRSITDLPECLCR